MKPQDRTVTVTVFRKGKQVSTEVLSIDEFRRRHPLGDPWRSSVKSQRRLKVKDAEAPNVLEEMHADEQLDVPLAPALARLLGQG